MKRRSATSYSPPEQVFFADRNLGRYIFPDQLRQVGVSLEIHDDHFPPGEQDPVWIAEAGKQGWIVLTADKRIRRVSLETEAIMSAGVQAFIFVGKPNVRRFAEAFLKARRRVGQLLAEESEPFIARIYRDGRVVVSLRHAEWEKQRQKR